MDDLLAVRKCSAGDWEAFRYLVEKYQARAIGHARSIVGNREDAMDAVQEAFLDAFQALGGFDSQRPFYPWLYAILRNRCFKLLAGRKRIEVSSLEEIQAEILAPASSLSREEALLLEQSLLALSPEDRELITLKHLDGLSYRELAEMLGIAEGTVMSRLYHARQRLRERLALAG
ncbi:MAG: sigma-70 family RNA polymerase sigma factor [Acidobacteria bacterium]|nr:sigma-70 family RNA polymerase sigma factor [Acidobacteriota bacterium]MCW5969070.1 sigma-70 family RNA polymerase sigma factor [Blastocatellales bacterium]